MDYSDQNFSDRTFNKKQRISIRHFPLKIYNKMREGRESGKKWRANIHRSAECMMMMRKLQIFMNISLIPSVCIIELNFLCDLLKNKNFKWFGPSYHRNQLKLYQKIEEKFQTEALWNLRYWRVTSSTFSLTFKPQL